MADIQDLNIIDNSNTDRWPEDQAPSSVNDAGRADEGILARWYQDTNGTIQSAGTGNAYTLTPRRTIAAYQDGLVFLFVADRACTGAVTLNVSGLGAKAVVKHFNVPLVSNDIKTGQIVGVIYRAAGDNFQLFTALGNAALTVASIGDTVQGFDANTAKTDEAREWTAPQHFGANAITSTAGTLALDFASSQVATVTLSENVTTITIANVTANSVVEVWFRQDATTARTVTGWPAAVDWFIEGSEPAVPATLDAFFVVSLRYDGTSYRASIAPN